MNMIDSRPVGVEKRALRIVAQMVALLALAVGVGCSSTQKILNSGDPELIYNTALKLYNAGEWNKAAGLFEEAEVYYNGTAREDSLMFFKARCLYKNGDYEFATIELDEFRRTYGRSVFLEDAEGMYTMSYYYLSPAPDRDQQMTMIAITAVDEFLSRHPDSEQCDTFREIRADLVGRLHEKAFINAYTYFKIGRYKSAIIAFKSAMKQYPDSELREKVSFYIVASAYELAHNSIESKREDRYLSMIDNYYTFIAEFPESTYRQQVDDMLKEAREYIAKKREREAKGEQVEERVLFWKRIFGKKESKDQPEKVDIAEEDIL